MKITIVMGFFLPMPPSAGGAIEKSWHRLTQIIAQRGHEVMIISRHWPDYPVEEFIGGVRHLRLPGFDHKRSLWINLLCDFIWSWRVFRNLPQADIIALNTVSLACWLGRLRPRAGRVIAMPGRMPKGQFKLYRNLARILVPSAPVRDAVIAERSSWAPYIRTTGYPIDFQSLAKRDPVSDAHDHVNLLYVGRIHREKGVELLIEASRRLSKQALPPWKAVICGPADIARGGSGEKYLNELKSSAPGNIEFLEAVFHEPDLHTLYRRADIFCYPSLADRGETFGVSVAEAMAAGCVPVTSDLACFRDFLTADKNALIFNAHNEDAISELTEHLAKLIRDPELRRRLASEAREAVRKYDFDEYASRLLTDFSQLTQSTPQA